MKPNLLCLFSIRHPSSQVRFAALVIAQDMYRKLGEEFTVLLPETIPFLAELMEGTVYMYIVTIISSHNNLYGLYDCFMVSNILMYETQFTIIV